MNYREMKFKPSYETGLDDLVADFYVPALEQAQRYYRIAGFFSSTSLALAARGLYGFIKNDGKMKLLTCPKLDANDVEMMEKSINNDEVLNNRLINDISNIEDEFQNDHVSALGWMLSNGYLEIKIALVYEKGRLLNGEEALSSSIMHQKVGIMYDEEWNGISFSGSNNESASGWANNIEEFKVFCSWKDGQKEYFQSDRDKFERLWGGHHPSVKIKSLPQAISEKLIEKGNCFDIEKISLKNYRKKILKIKTPEKKELTLFTYQDDAVKEWINNNYELLFEMATGCGKTRTAIGCMKSLIDIKKKAILIIIACPGTPLSMQWKKDLDSLNVFIDTSIFCDQTNTNWRPDLEKLIKKITTGFYRNGIVFTTHKTCSSKDFIDIIEQNADRIKILFIGDEVHGMGASKMRRGLLNKYDYKIGLSATPSRWFDENGTRIIENYFGGKSFVFTIHDALTTMNPLTNKPFLVNYYYHPHFISLTEEELDQYKKLSDRIIKMLDSKNEDKETILEQLLFRRADIEKKAYNKYSELELILDLIGEEIGDTIIFVSPEQLQTVLEILSRRNIPAHSYTENESTIPSDKYGGISERDYIVRLFAEKKYKVLVAIKCLDEGIDIPSAKRAIIMASSTNPREYVQRVGRVIRQDKNKSNAEIYDMIIMPDLNNTFNERFREMEAKIFSKEMIRVKELSQEALNNVEVLKIIYKIKGEF